MTILYPNHEEQTIDFQQIYTKIDDRPIRFSTFDLVNLENLTEVWSADFPCRSDFCSQLCRDESQHMFEGETRHDNGKGKFVCSCSRDYTQNTDYPELCVKSPQCHHSKIMCDLEVI